MVEEIQKTRLSDFQQRYTDVSTKASDVARQLAFAGIAVVWVLRGTETQLVGAAQPQQWFLPALLLPPLLGFCLALALDLFQYIVSTVIWGQFQWREERKLEDPKNENPPTDAPSWYKLPALLIFVLKLLSVTTAYFFLGQYILRRPDFPKMF